MLSFVVVVVTCVIFIACAIPGVFCLSYAKSVLVAIVVVVFPDDVVVF